MFIRKVAFPSPGSSDHVLQHRNIFRVNAAPDQLERHRCGWVKGEDRVQFRGPLDLVRFYRPRERAGFAETLTIGKECLAPAQLIFRLFALVDIRQQDIPVADSPFRVAQREPPRLEPPVDAVEASKALLDIERVAGGQ